MSSSTLANCPWCQNPLSDRRVGFEDRTFLEGVPPYRVWFGECECGARGPHGETPEDASLLYNERPDPFRELLQVLSDEDLIRFRRRLENAANKRLAEILSHEINDRAPAF